MKRSLLFILLLIIVTCAWTRNQVYYIQTDHTSLVYTVKDGRLSFRYYGSRLNDYNAFERIRSQNRPDSDRDLNYEAYPSYGTGYSNEPALSVVHSDGSLITEMQYLRDETLANNESFIYSVIYLKDRVYNFELQLHTKAYKKEDILTQWVVITNNEKGAVTLNNFYSSYVNLQANNYYLTHFDGTWAGEMNRVEERIVSGIKTIESKKGVRTTQTENPSFIISLNHPAEENRGLCYGGALAWSGNYRLSFEFDEWRHLNILSGVNPFLSGYTLEPQESFTTPPMIYTFSDEGQGRISRNFHDWSRLYALHDGYGEKPIVLNSWEGAYFDFDEKKLTAMMDAAARLGIETFVLDDGWFGNKYPRNNDNAGLGDWQVNKKKLPRGLQYLIDHAHSKGIQFGIWVEPEMVNPASELAEKHPDWIVQSSGREKMNMRNQLLLDLTNPAVQDFVWKTIDDLLSKHQGISYIKWDANRHVEQVGSTYLSSDKQTHFWINYVQGLYSVYDKIRNKYPDVVLQLCSSGGGRLDYGALKYHDEFWTSDNTDPLKRLYIQYSTNLIYPPVASAAHVCSHQNHQTGRITPLKFRLEVAMSGRLGFELQPKTLLGEDWEFAAQAIRNYKTHIRPLVTKGDLYRVVSPYDRSNDYTSHMYVSKDKKKAALFAYCTEHNNRSVYALLHLQGLQGSKKYKIYELDRTGPSVFWGNGQTFSGEFLMSVGIELKMNRQYDSSLFIVEMVE